MKLNKDLCKKCYSKVKWYWLEYVEDGWNEFGEVFCPTEDDNCSYKLEHVVSGKDEIKRYFVFKKACLKEDDEA